MNIINCTPHPINILGEDNEVILSLPKGEIIPRLATSTKKVASINNISITETVLGEVKDLPKEDFGKFGLNTIFIVSRLVLSACKDRKDLVVPNELVRDSEGKILGCKSLARN